MSVGDTPSGCVAERRAGRMVVMVSLLVRPADLSLLARKTRSVGSASGGVWSDEGVGCTVGPLTVPFVLTLGLTRVGCLGSRWLR
jgi:hypothetical protein